VTGRRVRQSPGGQVSGRWPSDDLEQGTVYSPSRNDPVVRAASTVIGGPAGRRLASATGFWRAIPVLVLLAAAMLSFGIVQKEHCRSQGWSSPDQFWHACYSDIPVLYGSSRLGADDRPGLVESLGQGGLGQPPLAGAMMWINSTLVPDSDPEATRQFFDLSAVVLTLVLAAAVTALTLTAGRRSWDAAHLALSPLLITAGLISYQLLAVAFLAAALLALARGRPIVGGVLLGLGIASAPQVAVVALVVAVLAGRYLRIGSGGIGAAFAGTAVGSWLIVRVLLLPGLTGELGATWKGWVEAVPGYGSFWLIPQLLGASEPDPATSIGGRTLQILFGWLFALGPVNGTVSSVLSLLLLAVLVVVILRLTLIADAPADPPLDELDFAGPAFGAAESAFEDEDLGAGRSGVVDPPSTELGWARFVTEKVAPLSLALLAAVLFTAKSLPIQASLLLLPLIALCGLRWRDHLIWVATELVYFVGIWLYIAGETTANRGLPAAFYLTLLAARLAGIAWIGVQAVLVYRAPSEVGPVETPVDETDPDRPPVDRFLSH
jgi:hypothetical protein